MGYRELFADAAVERDVAAMTARLDGRLPDEVDRVFGELVALRRNLHAEPELSGEEEQTTLALLERLALAGLAPRRLKVGTGLVCDVGSDAGGDRGPVVAVRADIDALAMPDAKSVSYASRVPGVAHACGHDVHTAIVLGVGLVLRRLLPALALPGRVRLVFEPNEEVVPGGALDVVAEGWLDDVDAMFAVHCAPKLDVATIGCRDGAMTSASDMVEVRLTGPGGHTARPHLTVDLVRALAQTALELPDELQRRAAEIGSVSLVFGAVRAGDAANVVPAAGILRGTLRTPSRDVWDAAPRLLEDSLAAVVTGLGAGWELRYTRGVPPTVNDVGATRVLAAAGAAVLGEDAVVQTEHSLGGDSFAWYAERVPASYARLGTHDPQTRLRRLDLHASTFDVDERAIGHGVQVLALAALVRLAQLERARTADDVDPADPGAVAASA